jgi:glucan phosphoethanolaminetransferase (alkaline phosphatase superfamily)
MTPEAFPAPAKPSRVSIVARIIPAFSYGLPAFGAAGSAYLFIAVMRAMRNAETAGIVAITAGISEANLVIVVALYLAIVVGLAGIAVGIARLFMTTTTASPSAWFYFVTGIIGFIPMLALWQAQSLMLEVMFSRSTGIVDAASKITLLLMLALTVGLVSVLILLATSVIPLPNFLRAKRKWAPPVMLVLMEVVVIVMTVLYHMRTAWLYDQSRQF